MGWFAWCSTNIGDQPLIQTVLILQHQTRTRFSELRSHSNLISVNNFSSFSLSESASSATNLQESSGNELNYPGVSIDADSSEIPASEEDLIEAMDSFHGNGNTIFNGQSKIAKAKSTNTVEVKNLSIHEATTEKITSLNNNINIKLKFINDDLKIVTSSLNELLGNFKRRHFQVELQSQKIVRLVFNGRVLQPDNQSLKKCGLYNDCVVHCLIHQPRSNTSPPAQSAVVNNFPFQLPYFRSAVSSIMESEQFYIKGPAKVYCTRGARIVLNGDVTSPGLICHRCFNIKDPELKQLYHVREHIQISRSTPSKKIRCFECKEEIYSIYPRCPNCLMCFIIDNWCNNCMAQDPMYSFHKVCNICETYIDNPRDECPRCVKYILEKRTRRIEAEEKAGIVNPETSCNSVVNDK
ncbi:uncharacterized protein [Prorops nasuta]